MRRRGGGSGRTEFGGFCGLGDGGERGEGEGEGNPPRQMPESNPESGIRFSVAYTLCPPPRAPICVTSRNSAPGGALLL